LFVEQTTHGGSASFLDRYLGIQDLYDAFEGTRRRELIWVEEQGGWRERVTGRPANCGWAFALMEMLVDPLLCEWVPKWIVEQYDRRNPHFREALVAVLREDRAHALTHRQLLFNTRRLMRRLLKAAERAAKVEEGADGGDGSTSGCGSGDDDDDADDGDAKDDPDLCADSAEGVEARCQMVQEPLPTADGFDDGGAAADDDWRQRNAEQRASAAGPAPMLVQPLPSLAPRIASASGVSVNPAGYKWDEENFVGLGTVKDLNARLDEWKDGAAGGEGEVLAREALASDPWQSLHTTSMCTRWRSVRTRSGLMTCIAIVLCVCS